MLEVNNFDSIRVALASPEQIRGWSKGEVTKPETINYRTLKPEKDGLFDERIFGPTRDWECYCGKYKRIRYKGIICDKCGVEVTRSKVRRERMGHIQLASPVSHIWYFKGTPSRLATLLDISPRDLEKVLYFAQYIVTSVDEVARQEALKGLDDELNGRGGGATAEEESEINARLKRQLAELDREERARLEQVESDRAERAQALGEAGKLIERAVNDLGEGKADGAIVFEPTGEVVVANGALGGKEGMARLRSILSVASIAEEDYYKLEMVRISDEVGEKKVKLNREADSEIKHLRENAKASAQSRKEEIAKEKKALLNLKAFQLLPEIGRENELDSFRTLDAKFGSERPRGARIFRAGMGAEAVRELIARIDLEAQATALAEEVRRVAGMRRKKAIKRLRLIQSFCRSGTRPEWMIMSVLPVIPPDLRPMVQLDGGRFATSDLNDLYRRVINRNNRLKRLIELGAPEIIVRNEKRMLQEAVDALIDNGRRGRAISGTGNHRLKSLSDMLKGKQGRFRQNLLGKRVDYSGRSVIVVGPELKLHECGIPKKMALELFKPFVMRQLVELGHALNIKSAKRLTERATDVVWEALAEVIKGHPVLLNRAPTLHRLGIQAFMPVLIEGSAIRIHPLVCTAFNADFDGDQMAVHVPLSAAAQQEARDLMLSSNNLLSPADGSPVVTPTQDIVFGVYYLTRCLLRDQLGRPVQYKTGAANYAHIGDYGTENLELMFPEPEDKLSPEDKAKGEKALAEFKKRLLHPDWFQGFQYQKKMSIRRVGNVEDALRQLDHGSITLNQLINVEVGTWDSNTEKLVPTGMRTTVGRLLFNEELPERLRFVNRIVRRSDLKVLLGESMANLGVAETARLADSIKDLGFKFSTSSGMTIAIGDIPVSVNKDIEVLDADKKVLALRQQYESGLITDAERYKNTVAIWQRTTRAVNEDMESSIDPESTLFMMMDSGARGNKGQMGQLGGMRGLVADPSGRIMELPIKASFRNGMQIDQYFNSTHGARKGLADTALRTADSGYLTRRLVDVAQDVITVVEDCKPTQGLALSPLLVAARLSEDRADLGQVDKALVTESLANRIVGRLLAQPFASSNDPDFLVPEGTLLTRDTAMRIAEHLGETPSEAVTVRSPLTCRAVRGVCVKCYGVLSATGSVVEPGVPIGIIAAQSIGEPGTQLTMRTFHTGGAVGRTRSKIVYVLDAKGNRQKENLINASTGKPTPRLEEVWVTESELDDLSHHHIDPLFEAPFASIVDGSLVSRNMKDSNKKDVKVEKRAADGSVVFKLKTVKDPISNKPIQEQALDDNGAPVFRSVKVGMEPVLRADGTPQMNKDGSPKLRPKYEKVPKMRDKKVPVAEMVSAKEFKVVKQVGFVEIEKTELIDISEDVTGSAGGGLSRVEEVLEARSPGNKAEIAMFDGRVNFAIAGDKRYVSVVTDVPVRAPLDLRPDAELCVPLNSTVKVQEVVAKWGSGNQVFAPQGGTLVKDEGKYYVEGTREVEDVHPLRADAGLLVKQGVLVRAGQALTEGPIAPADLLEASGVRSAQMYMVDEVQKVYMQQGVTIADKHIEVVLRQLFRFVLVDEPGDTALLPGQVVTKVKFESVTRATLAEGGEPASGRTVVMGVTKASLNTESFLSAASFQETTRVLTEAAITGARDYLVGLKENVIIGKLIPAGTGAPDKVAARKEAEKLRAAAALAGGDLPPDFGKDDFNVFLESEEGGASQDDVSQLVALLTEEKPTAEGETEANLFLADAAEAPKGDEGGA